MKTIKHLTQKNAWLFMMACVLLCLPFLFISCEKPPVDPPPPTPSVCDTCLPDITTTGKRTFGCRINGKVWLSDLSGFSVQYFNNSLIVIGDKRVTGIPKRQSISFVISPIVDTGFFMFPNSTLAESTVQYLPSIERTDGYYAKPAIKGFVHISRLDYEGGIISGTFEFDAYNNDNDTAHITDGRFDWRFY